MGRSAEESPRGRGSVPPRPIVTQTPSTLVEIGQAKSPHLHILSRSAITPEQRAIPKHKFAIMGLLDSVSGIMAVFAVNYISNAAVIVLLQQAAIPISMSISKLFLGARYTPNQVKNSNGALQQPLRRA